MNFTTKSSKRQFAIYLVAAATMLTAFNFVQAASSEDENLTNAGHRVFPLSPAPRSLVGMDVNLQIENATGKLASGYPNQGVIVKYYKNQDQWQAKGFGGQAQQNNSGTYSYHRTNINTAIEQSSDQERNSYVTTYTFDSEKSGRWVQIYKNGMASLSGKFTVVKNNAPAEQQLAPSTNAGLHIALIIKSGVSASVPAGSFPSRGLVLQSYAADGSLSFLGFGPGTLNSKGTYTYKKVSSNTAVEETIQTSDFFTLPYTMVYTFKTPTSGVWYQNFANGLIQFSGTFDTFPR